MTDFSTVGSKISFYHREWLNKNFNDTLPPDDYNDYTGTFAPRKVDILLRADELTGSIDNDLLDRIAAHPRLGRLIVFGAADSEKVAMMAREVMFGIQVRFCDSEEELRMLLGKRRSRAMVETRQVPLPS